MQSCTRSAFVEIGRAAQPRFRIKGSGGTTRLTGSRSKLAWEVNDCGEATGSAADKDRDLPVCVEARGRVSRGREIVVSVAVGTSRTGLTTSRDLAFASLIDNDGSVRFAKNLRELASWVR